MAAARTAASIAAEARALETDTKFCNTCGRTQHVTRFFWITCKEAWSARCRDCDASRKRRERAAKRGANDESLVYEHPRRRQRLCATCCGMPWRVVGATCATCGMAIGHPTW